MTDTNRAFTPRINRQPIGFRGQNTSERALSFNDQVINDIYGLSQLANTNARLIDSNISLMLDEIRSLKAAVRSVKDNVAWTNLMTEFGDFTIPFVVSFSDTDRVTRLDTPSYLQAALEKQFRLVTPAKNNAVPKFYVHDRNRLVQKSFAVEVTSSFDDVDWEIDAGGTEVGQVQAGEPLNAFNGNNSSFWQRIVSFPLHADINQVKVQLTVDVPGDQLPSNVLQIIPWPFGMVTIEDIEYTVDQGGNWQSFAKICPKVALNGEFNTIKNSEPIQLNFAGIDVRRIRITLSQDNWVEENGMKVFKYGLQELGLWYVDYEQSNGGSQYEWALDRNNNIAVKLRAPEGYVFTALKYFNSTPYDHSSRYLKWRVMTADQIGNPAGPAVWDSNSVPPQESSRQIDGNVNEVYVVCILNYVDSSVENNNAFPGGTPAYVESFATLFDVQKRT